MALSAGGRISMSVLIHVDHTPDIDIEHALRGDIEIQGWHYDRLPGIVDQAVKEFH